MSGLEVAGVVLGAVPLIVAALESYKTSKRLWARLRKTALHIDELIEALAENQALIEASVDSLFQNVGAEDALLVHDVVDYASRFRRKNIAPDIRSFMGKLYEPYEKALFRCEHTLLKIIKKFDGLILDSKVRNPFLSRNDSMSGLGSLLTYNTGPTKFLERGCQRAILRKWSLYIYQPYQI